MAPAGLPCGDLYGQLAGRAEFVALIPGSVLKTLLAAGLLPLVQQRLPA